VGANSFGLKAIRDDRRAGARSGRRPAAHVRRFRVRRLSADERPGACSTSEGPVDLVDAPGVPFPTTRPPDASSRASDRSVTRRVDPRPARRWPTIAAWCRVGDHDRSMYRLRPDLWCPRPRWLTRSTTAGGGRRRPRAPVGSGEAGESQRSDPDVPNCEEPAATQRGLFCARIVDEFAWALPAGDQAAVTTRMSPNCPGSSASCWRRPAAVVDASDSLVGPLCPR